MDGLGTNGSRTAKSPIDNDRRRFDADARPNRHVLRGANDVVQRRLGRGKRSRLISGLLAGLALVLVVGVVA